MQRAGEGLIKGRVQVRGKGISLEEKDPELWGRWM